MIKKNKLNYLKRSSILDLYNLASEVGLNDLIIIRKKDLNKNIHKYKNIILNLDDNGGGSHWVGINTKKKVYFDTYGEVPPNIIPKDYKQYKKDYELQDIDDEFCGQMTILALYYIDIGQEKKIYTIFKDIYKNV